MSFSFVRIFYVNFDIHYKMCQESYDKLSICGKWYAVRLQTILQYVTVYIHKNKCITRYNLCKAGNRQISKIASYDRNHQSDIQQPHIHANKPTVLTINSTYVF